MRFVGTRRFKDLSKLPIPCGWHRGTWGMIGAAAIGTGGAMLMGGGGGEERPTYNLPEYPTDPYVGKAQEALYPMGRDILAGDIPEYYKPIGEIGGELFEDVLGLGRRDIEKTGLEVSARLGQRGGGVAPGIAGKVGEYTRKARFDDYMRALKGRGFLLGVGADITAGVGARGLTAQAQQATYEVSKGNLALGYAGLASKERMAEGEAMGAGISGGISGLANIYAMSQLGKVSPDTSSVYDTGAYTPSYTPRNDYLDQGMYFGNWGTPSGGVSL